MRGLAFFVLAIAPCMAQSKFDGYRMERNAEIALARSAGPESISRDAEILVLGQRGYETAAKGKNGFVCVVQRSWTAGSDDPEFWNPKVRAPICYNPAAVKSYLPVVVRKTELILAGQSKEQMFNSIKAAVVKHEMPPLEAGAMCYMLAKQGHLNDRDGHWHPHLMFFAPQANPMTWGAGAPGSPLLSFDEPETRLTVLLIPVEKWSDGTAASHP